MYLKILNKIFFIKTQSLDHYEILKRNIIIVMLFITIIPLFTMLIINYFQYRFHLKDQVMSPLYAMIEKTRHSFELFLDQRLAIIRFISTSYSFEELCDEKIIKKVLVSLKREGFGFVDIGLINSEGELTSYVGPYALLGKNYLKQNSFKETQVKGKYISNVFMGHRKYPHIVIAVQHLRDNGQTWILRATIGTYFFDNLISSMGLPRKTDAFLISKEGVLQTNSLYYGNTLEECPIKISNSSFKSSSIEQKDSNNRNIFVVSAALSIADYILVIVQPRSVAMGSWYALKTEMIIIVLMSLGIIIFAIIRMSDILVKKIRTSDKNRENVLAELQHAQKLSSIGRLAAGVAHEINNPLAIINQKAGLMNDLIYLSTSFDKKTKFIELTESILNSVDRCRKITHRLLGFSKRIDVEIKPININIILKDVLAFLEKDILYRRLDIRMNLLDSLKVIDSDHGQIEQVLLNLLTNAFAAVENFGIIGIETVNNSSGGIRIKIEDNGCGIPKNIIENIFDPFFSTKKDKGTGLGLSITYGIIKKLGGEISVRSKEGIGTVFTVDLPDKFDEMELENE